MKGPSPIIAVLLAWCLPSTAANAAPAPGEAAGPEESAGGRVHTAYLEYQEAGEPLMNWALPASSQAVTFQKEPDFGQRKVFRGNLPLGGKPSAFIPFVWDRAQGKLYLDLNRNLDLTDDSEGVFTCSSKRSYQTFTNVHLAFQTPSGTRRLLVDLSLADYGNQRPGGYAGVRSFWQGKIRLQGQDWQVGVVESVAAQITHSHLLLRPWQNRNEPFSLMDGSLDAFAFPTNLFFQNQAYQVICNPESEGDPPKLKLQFREEPAKLGELKLAGAFLQRVILEPGDYTVVLDTPAAVVKVPVGNYGQHRVWLQRADAKAYRNPGGPTGSKRIAVNENEATVLPLGGPLTNSVTVTRRTKELVFSYQLLGADGAPYQLVRQDFVAAADGVRRLVTSDRSKPPEWIVFQGEKKIASGRFEFG